MLRSTMATSSQFNVRDDQDFSCRFLPGESADEESLVPVCLIGKRTATLVRMAELRLERREQLSRGCGRCLSAWIKQQKSSVLR
jgi:hypothetical protein